MRMLYRGLIVCCLMLLVPATANALTIKLHSAVQLETDSLSLPALEKPMQRLEQAIPGDLFKMVVPRIRNHFRYNPFPLLDIRYFNDNIVRFYPPVIEEIEQPVVEINVLEPSSFILFAIGLFALGLTKQRIR